MKKLVHGARNILELTFDPSIKKLKREALKLCLSDTEGYLAVLDSGTFVTGALEAMKKNFREMQKRKLSDAKKKVYSC